MRRIHGKACAVILAGMLLVCCSRSPEARRDKYMEAGKQFLAKKDFSRALLQFKNAAQATPKDAEPYYQMGLAALLLGDLRTGVTSLKRAVGLNPKHAGAQLKLAELMALGNEALVRQAESSLKELRDTSPVTPEMLKDRKSTRLNSSHLGISY